MKIRDYIGSILPSFEKSQVMEDIRTTREELVNNSIPVYKNAASTFKGKALTNSFSSDFETVCKKRVDGFKQNHLNTIYLALVSLEKNLDVTADIAEQEFSNVIMREALTFVKTQLLQYVEVAAFVSQYARRYLLLAYTMEVKGPNYELSKVEQRDFRWLQSNRDAFLVALNGALLKAKEVEEKLLNAPDILVTENSIETVGSTRGLSKSDPFNFRFIPTWVNPIYHLRMALADRQIARHKLAKEEKETLELKLFHLKQIRDGKQDAKLEQQIAYTEERIEKLRYRIHKLDSDAE